jgi:hypothetical protein
LSRAQRHGLQFAIHSGGWRGVSLLVCTCAAQNVAAGPINAGNSDAPSIENDDYDGELWQRATQLLCPRRASMAYKLLACFDLVQNYQRMVSINVQRSGDTAALHGVRAISLGLVIFAHTVYFMQLPGLINPADFYPPHGIMGTWAGQVRTSSLLSPPRRRRALTRYPCPVHTM